MVTSDYPYCRKGAYGTQVWEASDDNETMTVVMNCTNCELGKHGILFGSEADSGDACEGPSFNILFTPSTLTACICAVCPSGTFAAVRGLSECTGVYAFCDN